MKVEVMRLSLPEKTYPDRTVISRGAKFIKEQLEATIPNAFVSTAYRRQIVVAIDGMTEAQEEEVTRVFEDFNHIINGELVFHAALHLPTTSKDHGGNFGKWSARSIWREIKLEGRILKQMVYTLLARDFEGK